MKTLQTFAFLVDPTRADDFIQTVAGSFAISSGPRSTRRVTYYDTFDWRLHNRGLRLTAERRVEPGKSQEVEVGLEGADEALHMGGDELSGDGLGFVWDLPSGRLREKLEPVVAMRRVLPLMEVTIENRGWSVLDDEQKTVARLRLETGEVASTAKGSPSRPLSSRLYVDPIRGYDTAQRLSDFLHKKLDLRIADRPLFEESAAAAGLEPGGYSSKVKIKLHSGETAGEAAQQIFLQLLDTMQVNEEGTRLDLDSEFLHDFRVAVRRTRAGLSQIKQIFPEDQTEHFKRELSWLGKLTGPTRDLDVYLLKMPGYRRDLPPEIAGDLEPLSEFLVKRQLLEQKKLAKGLQSARYGKLTSDWRSFLEGEIPSGPANAKRLAVEVASERIWKLNRRIVKWGLAIDDTSPAEKLHDVRLECKKLRYMMEFFRSLYPAADVEASIKELKRLQENLGDFNDYEVQQASLAAFAEEMATERLVPTATLLAMGRLQSLLADGQQGERDAFSEKLARFADRGNQQRFKELFKLS